MVVTRGGRKAGHDLVWLVVVVFLVLVLLLVGSASAAPTRRSERITLQIQPELLMGHRLVLSLEPVSDTRSSKSLLNSHVSTTTTTTSSQNDDQDTTTTVIPYTTTATFSSTTTDFPSTTTLPPSSSQAPDLTTTVDNADSTSPVTAVISKFSGLPSESDVDKLLITIPRLRCPQGYLVDPRGNCRAVFRRNAFNRSRSISDALSSHSHHFPFLNVPPLLPFSPLASASTSLSEVTQEVNL